MKWERLKKYLDDMDLTLVVWDLGGGDFENPQIVERKDIPKLCRETWETTAGNVDLEPVV